MKNKTQELRVLERSLKDRGLLDNIDIVRLLDGYKEKASTKYGLVWEEHPELVEEQLKTGLTSVKEYKNKQIINDKDKPQNLLIEGDNLHGLMLLKEENVKVDVIYIDPPYNTGNEFVYNDKIVDKEDGYRHSKWLSFMSKRLELAYDLLADDGVICISIDDNEQANLKLLMDKIFGESNFINTIVWHYGKMSNESRKFANNHEYILCYGKSQLSALVPKSKKEDSEYKNRWINYVKDNKIIYGDVKGKKDKMLDLRINKIKRELGRDVLLDDDLLFDFDSEYKVDSDTIYVPTIKGNSNEWISDFDVGQKPLRLLYKIFMSLLHKKNGLFLDFFAGSGTTGQAVMELNKEDGGNRQFILMTNNEVSTKDTFKLAIKDDKTKQLLLDNDISLKAHKGTGSTALNEQRNKDIENFFENGDGKDFFNSDIVQDEGICRKVTYERLRRVIEGDYAKGKVEPLPNNLSYYKLEVEQNYNFEDKHRFTIEQSLLGLTALERTTPIQIDEYTYVFDRGQNEALVYDASIYTKKEVMDKIKDRFKGYSFEVMSEFNNADIKIKALRKGVIK